MKKFYLALMCMACIVLCSCRSSKEAALNDLRDFSTEIQQNGSNYDTNDWKKAVKKYKKINEKIAKHSYNSEEMTEIGTLQGECVKSFAGSLGTKVTGIIGFLKGLGSSIGSSVKDFDVDKLFENIMSK